MDQTGDAYCNLAFAVRSETRGGAPDASCSEEGATDPVRACAVGPMCCCSRGGGVGSCGRNIFAACRAADVATAQVFVPL